MKVVILAGGLGTRLMEETVSRPKPMVEIGGMPILWHIMNIYAEHGHNDFIVACGYKAAYIKEYFSNYFTHSNDITINLENGKIDILNAKSPKWKITLIDTGLNTMTGGRIKRLKDNIGDETFMATYGDGVGNINISEVLKFHKSHGKLATVTAVHPPARFGGLVFDGDRVSEFSEKPQTGEGWINGGFFIFEPKVLDYMDNDETVLEREPLEKLASDGELMAYKHKGFWQPMDTLREKNLLEDYWKQGNAPWKIWK